MNAPELGYGGECTCELPGPNYEGPWAGCDVHGMPSVSYRQGQQSGRAEAVAESALHWQHERDTLVARMQDDLFEQDVTIGPDRPVHRTYREGFEAGVRRCVEIMQTKDTGRKT